jgi:putative ABC transport system substrate-binding protein
MRRREVISLLGGAAAAWPLAVRAQQRERMRRIGVLLAPSETDTEYPALLRAFLERLQQLGWAEGRNLQLDVRWSGGQIDRIRRKALELVALGPDVIVGPGAATAGPLVEATRSIPIVFMIVPDPVGAGFVQNLARPGGNVTGFASFEFGIAGKWLELLKQVAPSVTRVATIREPVGSAGIGQFAAIQSMASLLGLDASPLNVREAPEIESAIAAFARSPNGGLVVTSSALAVRHRDLIITLAARHKLPAVYYARIFASSGGLISYGPDRTDQLQRAAGYVDRILKGEKPADLPVQAPTKYELVINLKTAKALGIEVPPTLLAIADEATRFYDDVFGFRQIGTGYARGHISRDTQQTELSGSSARPRGLGALSLGTADMMLAARKAS